MPSTEPGRATAEDRLRRWGHRPTAPLLLFVLAVVEATVFPAPTEALLVALVLARPGGAIGWSTVATLGSVAGGAIGYAAGAALISSGAAPLLEWSGSGRWLGEVGALYRESYAVALLTSGFTPIPYLVYTGAAGAAGVPLAAFLALSLLGRGLKYSVVGGLALLLGPAVRRVLARTGPAVAAATAAALLIAYLLATR